MSRRPASALIEGRHGFAGAHRTMGVWGPFGAPMTKRFDSLGALGYKVRVLSPFPAMETYADD